MSEAQKETKSNTFFKFDKIALIIGFIADVITLSAIIFSLKIPEISKNLPYFITPGLAFTLWILALYIYFALLHAFWEKEQTNNNYSKKFSLFFFNDLLFSFRNPPLLLPALILFLCLFWIASITDKSGALLGILTAFSIFFLPIILGFIYEHIKTIPTNIKNNIPNDFKERVNTEWKFLSNQINEHLEKQMWVRNEDLASISIVWEVPEYLMDYVLAQFAVKNPKKTKFCYIYQRSTNFIMNSGEKVLVNLEIFDKQKYYYK